MGSQAAFWWVGPPNPNNLTHTQSFKRMFRGPRILQPAKLWYFCTANRKTLSDSEKCRKYNVYLPFLREKITWRQTPIHLRMNQNYDSRMGGNWDTKSIGLMDTQNFSGIVSRSSPSPGASLFLVPQESVLLWDALLDLTSRLCSLCSVGVLDQSPEKQSLRQAFCARDLTGGVLRRRNSRGRSGSQTWLWFGLQTQSAWSQGSSGTQTAPPPVPHWGKGLSHLYPCVTNWLQATLGVQALPLSQAASMWLRTVTPGRGY